MSKIVDFFFDAYRRYKTDGDRFKRFVNRHRITQIHISHMMMEHFPDHYPCEVTIKEKIRKVLNDLEFDGKKDFMKHLEVSLDSPIFAKDVQIKKIRRMK